MKRIVWLMWPMLLVWCTACQRGYRTAAYEAEGDTLQIEPDTLAEEPDDEVEEGRMDENFDDFLFSFIHSRRLQRERVVYPLPRTESNGETETLNRLDCKREFSFLENDFYTVFYGSTRQIDEQKQQSHERVEVEHILLDSLWMGIYSFERRDGHWLLTAIHNQDLRQGELTDFLTFYARFSSDSTFQQRSIAQPLRFSMLDSDDNNEYIEGTIDASQWASFGAEMPQGEITNIRYGQTYNPRRVVMQKCGQANGMQELFTFEKRPAGWRLVAYDN